jgi:DNA-binding transcriptional LysR family regulator
MMNTCIRFAYLARSCRLRIKLRQLEVFDALIEAGSVSRAAGRLNLSQPAVSIALAKLEAELGYRLFHRDRGYFSPTNEALLLHEEVRQGIDAMARIEQRSDEIRTGRTGGIVIGTNGVMSMNFLPQIVAQFQRNFPDSFVELRVHSSRQLASWVSTRQVDIALIDAPVPVAGLTAEFYRMECVCIMRDDDPLSEEKVITPSLLSDRPGIAITGDHVVDRQLGAIMSQADARLIHSGSSYFYAIARQLVAAGDSLAIIDPVNGKARLKDGVIWRPFKPAVLHELAMITSRDHPLGLSAARIQRDIREGIVKVSAP